MAYSFVSIEKIKSIGTMTSKYNHNCRIVEVTNVIECLSHLNDELVPLPTVDGEQLGYKEVFEQRIKESERFRTRKIRNDAVLGYEVLMTFSREADIDVDEWKKQSMKWLHDYFDVAPDKKSNVLHAVCHEDEVGNIHIHAFVVPIDEFGSLNARRFTGGHYAMTDIQTTYNDYVKDLGLERGLAGSSARHQDIKKFYAELNQSKNIKPLENETGIEFYNRYVDELETMFAQKLKRFKDYERNSRRALDEDRIAQHEMLQQDLNQHNAIINDRYRVAKEKLSNIKKDISDLEVEHADKMRAAKQEYFQKKELIDQAERDLEFYQNQIDDIEYISKKAKEAEVIDLAFELMKEREPEKATAAITNLEYYIDLVENGEVPMHDDVEEYDGYDDWEI